jgi:DNA-binding NtrC family response regulator
LRDGPLVLGRATTAPELAALAEDGAISRCHAVVTQAGDRTALEDQQSRNGTFVNGERVTGAALADGDLIRVGRSLLLFREEVRDGIDGALPGLSGRSRAIRQARALLAAAAPSTATVLLLGETGTGKTRAARAVHELSGRPGPFVPVNCAAIPEGLAESSLFGHVAGAFTDAKRDHAGFLRGADRGTLFLDEIGEIPLGVQAKLLSAVEEKRAVPLGAVTPVASDVRIIAATNVDLARAVHERRFRGDLFARVGEVVVRLPPLRERREDILLLLSSFIGPAGPCLPALLAEAAVLFGWTYNIRELRQVASEWTVLSRTQPAMAEEALLARLRCEAGGDPAEPTPVENAPSRQAEPRGVPSREELERLLTECRGKVTAVAERVDRSRKQVYRWLEQYGMDPDRYRWG